MSFYLLMVAMLLFGLHIPALPPLLFLTVILIWTKVDYKRFQLSFLSFGLAVIFSFGLYFAAGHIFHLYDDYFLLKFGLTTLMMYFLGANTLNFIKDKKSMVILLTIFMLSHGLHAELSLIYSFIHYDFFKNMIFENLRSFWPFIPHYFISTQWGVMLSCLINFVFISFAFFPHYRHRYLLTLVLFLSSAACLITALLIDTRGPVINFFVTTIAITTYVLFHYKKENPHLIKKALFALGIFFISLLGIYKLLAQTTILIGEGRLETVFLSSSRFQAWNTIFHEFFNHPWGGKAFSISLAHQTLIHAHNVWLDFFYDAGIISFIAFTLFTLWHGIKLIQWLRVTPISYFPLLILIVSSTFFMAAMYEPIHLGNGRFFLFGIYCCGVISSLTREVEIKGLPSRRSDS